jgi:hypothetical protein
MRAFRTTAVACLLPLSALSAGCGGGERQDKNEPKGNFAVAVEQAKFPGTQRLAEQAVLSIVVKNTDTKTLPDVAVTVDRFTSTSDQVGLADSQRPVWIVDRGPVGGETAYVNTWALGPLAPGATKTFTWKVTAIQPGAHELKYKVSPGLAGRARVDPSSTSKGTLRVNISRDPSQARVNPTTGAVERGKGATAQP